MGQVDEQFTKRTNDFALELYKQAVGSKKSNVVISPISISTCLSLAAMGASGKTAEEMLSQMNYGGASEKESVANHFKQALADLNDSKTVKIANKVYLQEKYSVKPKFNELATKHFFSETQVLNFKQNVESAKSINGWVENKTNNKIKDLISADDLSEDTRMVLVNAIHFKGTWKYQFDSSKTLPSPFWITATESVDVPTMNIKKHFKYGVIEELESTALELTYQDTDVSMLIILPNERDGLSKLESKLKTLDLQNIMSHMHSQEVEVYLPKFKIEHTFDLKEALDALGMGTMFTDNAEFNDLLEQDEPLKVSKVIHKAFIEINEEGAEAAAATAVVMRLKRCATFSTMFKVEHPYLFFIHTPLRHILFSGNIRDLSQFSDIASGNHDEL